MTAETEMAASSAGTPEAWYRMTESGAPFANSGSASDAGGMTITPDATGMTFQTDTNVDGNPAAVEFDGTGTNNKIRATWNNYTTHFTGKGTLIMLVKWTGTGFTTSESGVYFWGLGDNTFDDDSLTMGVVGDNLNPRQPQLRYFIQDDTTSGDNWGARFSFTGKDLQDGNWWTLGVTITDGGVDADNPLYINGVEYIADAHTETGTVDNDWWPDEAGWTSAVEVVLGNRPQGSGFQPEDWRVMECIVYANSRLTEAQHLEVHQILNPSAQPDFSVKTKRRRGRRLFARDV